MTFATLWTIFKGIGSGVGIIITLVTFWGLISKKPKAALHNMILNGCKAANSQIEDDMREVLSRLNKNDQATVVSLRHSITNIYENYKQDKKFPIHVKEDLMSLLDQYDSFGGNSYVHTIVEEMKTWDVE